MLRVTIFDTATEQRLVLEGKLTEPWIPEIESAWEKARNQRQGRKCVIDLSETTVIDRNGKRVLAMMCNEGAQFIVEGIATRHLIRVIQRACAERHPNTMAGKHQDALHKNLSGQST
jgi:anti-anti-sigma regulatory factor